MKEHREREDRRGRRDGRCREREPGHAAVAESGRRVGAETEQQSAADRDAVQQDVGNLTDAVRDEPLQPLVRGTDDQSGENRQDEDRRILERRARRGRRET